MPELSFSSVVVVAAAAFLVPLVLGLVPRLRIPSVVVEIVVGIIIGPAVLGWVRADTPVQLLALFGLAFLLLLAGLDLDLEELRGHVLQVTTLGFVLSFGLALAVGYLLSLAGLVRAPLLIAIMLSATALGTVIAVLKDANQSTTRFGQLVIGGATVADFATIVLLTLFFSREATDPVAQIALLAGLGVLSAAVVFALLRVEHAMWLTPVLRRLQDTSAQIRVRGAFLLLAVFVALAERLGLELILGAFIAGVVLKLVDRDEGMTHPLFHHKLEAIGFGVFVPAFFIATGLRFNVYALVANPATLALVPVFLAALLVVRGLPALLYRGDVGNRRTAAAALLQATSLGFIVITSQIGMELGVLDEAVGAALIGAGLLSVLLFPLLALVLLQPELAEQQPATTLPPTGAEVSLRAS